MYRKHVIDIFKQLHRTRKKVFQNDSVALEASKLKINQEFRNNMNQTDDAEVKKLLKVAEDAEMILRTQVVQAKEITPGVFKANITEDTFKDENYPFKPDAKLPKNRKGRKCTS